MQNAGEMNATTVQESGRQAGRLGRAGLLLAVAGWLSLPGGYLLPSCLLPHPPTGAARTLYNATPLVLSLAFLVAALVLGAVRFRTAPGQVALCLCGMAASAVAGFLAFSALM